MDTGCSATPGDLHVVFDFYNDNPQRSRPPETPESDSEEASPPALPEDTLCTEPYWTSIRAFQDNDIFLEGMLLKSLDRNAKFPYIHYIVYNSGSAPAPPHQAPDVKGSPVDSNQCRHNFLHLLGSQGGYREMYTFVDRHTSQLPKRPQNPLAAYIISAFKVMGNLEQLDKTWSYWSGADFIVESIPKSLLLQRLTFHKTRYDVDDGTFAYVMLCELGDALGDVRKALEFVEKLKNRECGFTSLYTIDHFF